MNEAVKLEVADYKQAHKHMVWQAKRLAQRGDQLNIIEELREFCDSLRLNIEQFSVNEKAKEVFFGMLIQKFKLDHLTTLSLILIAQKELAYEQYKSYIGPNPKDTESIIIKSYAYDLKYHKTMDLGSIKRLIGELGPHFKQKFFNDYKMSLMYRRAAEEVKLKKCATSLLNCLRKETKEDTLTREIVGAAASYACDISFEANDYYMHIKDCRHDQNDLDEYYRNHCTDIILAAYNGCAKCHVVYTTETPLSLVPLWRSKAECGNFAMRSKKGYYVNNCIPLCKDCYTEEVKQSLFLALDQDEMIGILSISQEVGHGINKAMSGFVDQYFPKYEKVRSFKTY